MPRAALACLLPVLFALPVTADHPTPAAGPDPTPTEPYPPDILQRDTLTGDWFGLGRKLQEDCGITFALSATQVYQINLTGGISTHRRNGRYEGSYDAELFLDLEKLLKLPGGLIYLRAEGDWSRGLDPTSIGSAVGNVNGDAYQDLSIALIEYWYEQAFFDKTLAVRLGKLDITGGFEHHGCAVAFDCNQYANDETLQFLNAALVNNPTIPFPDYGLAAAVIWSPVKWWYVSGGIADALADRRESGFNTAFEGKVFTVQETGVRLELPSPRGEMVGAYRFGLWYDSQEKPTADGDFDSDSVGFYLSFDQMVYRESADDEQGLGVFFRYGLGNPDTSTIEDFWSVGCQYQGLIPTRDDDVLGFGVAQGTLERKWGFNKPQETIFELYYGCWITPWLQIAPDFQYILNPGGTKASGDAFVIGFRAQIAL